MRIIITGGTGLIGSSLTKKLVEAGHEVIVLTRSPEKHRGELPESVQLVKYDGNTAEGWGHLADGADAIVNLAGEPIAGEGFPPPRWTEEHKRRVLQSRLDVGHAVVEAVEQAENKPGVVIQASGVDHYGWPGDEVVTESSQPGDTYLARVTLGWEGSTAAVEEMGVRRCVARTGFVLSDKGGSFPVLLTPFKLFIGGPLGSGEQYIPWIHIEDEARALQFLIEHPGASGAYNLTAPKPVKQKTFAKIIGRTMGRPSFIPAPAPALKLILGEQAGLVLNGQRAIPKRLVAEGFTFKYTEPEQAVKDLLGQQGYEL